MRTFLKFSSLCAAILLSVTTFAQVTTSSMSGRINDATGALPGATVVALHTPSGTSYGAVTNNSGIYTIQGMRSGGPYTVTVSYLGFSTQTYTDVNIPLGDVFKLDAILAPGVQDLAAVSVTATKTKFSVEKTGATTNISGDQLRLMPSINRSLSDIAKISPYSNGMGFAGGDGRSSNFTIDGANLNNNFGLSSSLPGGGNPISLDAIEAVQVVVAPFDVRQTNFVGGGINAITKSGTNEIKASVYDYFKNQDLRGNRIGKDDFGARAKESRNVVGFTFGAPILKDKLFIFANFEYEKQPTEVIKWKASDDGVTNHTSISRTTNADLETVSNFLKSKYGYETGSWTNFPANISNLKYLVRLDWNINEANKLSVRFNYTKNKQWYAPNGNSNDAGLRISKDRVSEWSMSYANSMYSQDNIVYSGTAELNSRITNKISNQFLATYSDIQDVRGSTSQPFPFIDIMSGDIATGYDALDPYISAGYELFTWNNGVKNRIITITDNMTFLVGKHKITAGLNYEYQMADNNYMRNGTAYYRYASISDFIGGAAPVDFALTYGTNGNLVPSNAVKFNQFGLYAQDEWSVTDNFKLTYGLRADLITFVDNILTNKAILELDFGGRNINTGLWPTPKVNFSPRVGFRWNVTEDKALVLRGGTGLFTGRLPLVFFTNMPSNAGMNQILMKLSTTWNADGTPNVVNPNLALLANLDPNKFQDVAALIELLGFQTEVTDGSLPSAAAGVDPKFKMPQVWKTSLALDYNIPVSFPFTVTVEGMFTKNINAVMLDNYSVRKPDETWATFEGSDNRYIYPAGNDRYYTTLLREACVLTNTNKGYGYTANITLTAQPVKPLSLMFAYTHTSMLELSGMPGSNAASAWTNLYTINGPNVPTLQRSQYVIPDKIIASIDWKLPHWNNTVKMPTTLSLFYVGMPSYYNGSYYYSGGSFIYSNDMNGDGLAYDLIYIPKERGDIQFVSQADEDAFFAFMSQDKYLNNHKGEYAKAYSATTPWLHRFDFRIMQDITFNIGKRSSTVQISLDVLNIGNLLNSKWGVAKSMSSSNDGKILKYEGVDAVTNKPTFSMNKFGGEYIKDTWMSNVHYSQCWTMQLGARWTF